MAEVRSRAGKAQSVTPSPVSITTPEMAMFLPDMAAEQGLPVEALTCCITRAEGVAQCLWRSLNEHDLDDEAGAAWALIGLIGQLDRLISFAAEAELRDFAASTSTEGSHHA